MDILKKMLDDLEVEYAMHLMVEHGMRMALDKERDLSGTSHYAVMRGTDLRLYVRTLADGQEPRPGMEHRHMPHTATCAATATAKQPTLPEPEDLERTDPN